MGYAAPARSPNRLLAVLSPADFARVRKHMQPVSLSLGQVLHEPGTRIRHVYFPYSSVISLLSLVSPNKGAEVGMVGNEGIAGASAAFGPNIAHLRSLVQGAGTAMRMSAPCLREECNTNASFNRALLRFSYVLLVQAAQTAACNRFHKIPARLARWLLVTRDRLHSDDFALTHQLMSVMLGVRRVGVTVAAGALEKQGLIAYSRGRMQIVKPKALERAACECYKIVRSAYRKG
ncbi:MAG: Crp/Fnr family transcriptional regulator [Burkholderiales bacterium]